MSFAGHWKCKERNFSILQWADLRQLLRMFRVLVNHAADGLHMYGANPAISGKVWHCSMEKTPARVRRKAASVAGTPSAVPISSARTRMYVPLEQDTRRV